MGPGQGRWGLAQEAPGKEGTYRLAPRLVGRQPPGTRRIDQHQIQVPGQAPMLETVVENHAVTPRLDELLSGP